MMALAVAESGVIRKSAPKFISSICAAGMIIFRNKIDNFFVGANSVRNL